MSRNYSETTDNTNPATAAPQTENIAPEDDTMSRFTAAGRPNRATAPSGLDNVPTGGFATLRPNLLPVKFHDDDIISVPVWVTNSNTHDGEASQDEKPGFADKIKGLMSSEKEKDKKLVTAQMPRRDYLKFFTKDEDGNYIGTEPQQTWTEEKLHEMFGQYKKPPMPKSNESFLDKAISGLGPVSL